MEKQESLFGAIQKHLPCVKSLTVDPIEQMQEKDKSKNYNLFLPEKFSGERQLTIKEE